MIKSFIVIIFSLLLTSCSYGNIKLENTALDNISNNVQIGDGEYAVYEDKFFYYSYEHMQLVSKKIGTDNYDIEKKFSSKLVTIADLNFSGDNLIYLEKFMTKGEGLYKINSYNVSKNRREIDFTWLNEAILLSDYSEGLYPSITDILVIDDNLFINVTMDISEDVSNHIFGVQYIYDLKTGELKILNLKNLDDPDNPIKFLGYYLSSNGNKRFLYESRGRHKLSDKPIGYFELSDANEVTSHQEINLISNNSKFAGLSDHSLIFRDLDGTYIMNLLDHSIEYIWKDWAYGAVGIEDKLYINLNDGLYLFDTAAKKAEKLVSNESISTPVLYKFNNMLYSGFGDDIKFKYDIDN